MPDAERRRDATPLLYRKSEAHRSNATTDHGRSDLLLATVVIQWKSHAGRYEHASVRQPLLRPRCVLPTHRGQLRFPGRAGGEKIRHTSDNVKALTPGGKRRAAVEARENSQITHARRPVAAHENARRVRLRAGLPQIPAAKILNWPKAATSSEAEPVVLIGGAAQVKVISPPAFAWKHCRQKRRVRFRDGGGAGERTGRSQTQQSGTPDDGAMAAIRTDRGR